MASTSSSSSSSSSSFQDKERPNIESIRSVVTSSNQLITEFLQDTKARKSAKLRCISKLTNKNSNSFEFSEQSILSNLYWAIESIESAAKSSNCLEEISCGLKSTEKMLQAPALLSEEGVTAGIPNIYLVCCSYFYLSVVKKLQGDEWQVASHFLQAVFVSPRLVWTVFLPELISRCEFISCLTSSKQGPVGARRGFTTARLMEFDEDEVDEVTRLMARRYKAWLTYYQVMSYGENASAASELQIFRNLSIESSGSGSGKSVVKYCYVEPITQNMEEKSKVSDIMKHLEHVEPIKCTKKACAEGVTKSSHIKCLQDWLIEYQSDTSCNISADEIESEVTEDEYETSKGTLTHTDDSRMEIYYKNQEIACSKQEIIEECIPDFFTGRFHGSTDNNNCNLKKAKNQRRSHHQRLPYQRKKKESQGNTKSSKQDPNVKESENEVSLYNGGASEINLMGIIEKAISNLCFSEELERCDEEYTAEFVKVYEMLSNKRGVKYTLLKDMILDQLLTSISASKEVGVIRASISILSSLVSWNKAVAKEINKNGSKLCDLANALKRDVHEAAILIYLINPPPEEIKMLEILQTLVEVLCSSRNYKNKTGSLLPTPPVAALMIIEILVSAFDYDTNDMHLAAVSTPQVIYRLLDVPRNNHCEEVASLAAVLVRCMRFDGHCKKYISNSTSMAPFISLLQSNKRRTTFVGLEFLHEILRTPRSIATTLLQRIQEEGSIYDMPILLLIIQQSEDTPAEYKLLAANLLVQLDILEDSPSMISTHREAPMDILLKTLASEENISMQQSSAFLLSNLGGTYAWTGEPYTAAWLLKKTGLTRQHHRNMIRNINWLDQTLQDPGVEVWCSKISRSVTAIGESFFQGLENGLRNKNKKVSRDCLIATAWVGCEIAKAPDSLRYTACEILLTTVEQFLHPGLELEERLLACLCVYNYTSGKGMQKIIHFSEGVRESLRRLSSVTWMAEELLRVANYFQPDKWRISCVHTQVLETSQDSSGAVTAMMYYKGQLCSGYADGSIKVWDIKGQTATLLWDIQEHKKAVTCFSLFEPRDCMLSGSSDKTIRIWQMVQRKLECIEVIAMKKPIQQLATSGQLIFTVIKGHQMKVFDASRTNRNIHRGKNVKCVRVINGKAYIGRRDSSIKELAITTNCERVIKSPSKRWWTRRKAINSICVHKDWLYSASTLVEGSNIKDWRRGSKPQVSIMPNKGAKVLAMEVVEDFIYLNCSQSTSILQIWLRGTQQNVGRLSAGSKITSLLSGNDMVLCGTETGLIKGWIPL